MAWRVPDLYAELEIDRSATRDQVRRAYRKAAKRAHPDTGGSKKKFALVKLAHDVLTDAQRREKYDATGEIEETPVDTAESDALQWVQMALDQILTTAQQRNIDPTAIDVIADMIRFCNEKKKEIENMLKQQARSIEITRKISARFKPKKGKTDRFAALMAGRLTALEQNKARNEGQLIRVTRALEIIGDHKFDWTAQSRWSYA